MEYKASVPGKVILTGEHAVVYGIQAIAGSVEIRNEVHLKVTESPFQVTFKSFNNTETIPWDSLTSFKDEVSVRGIFSLLVLNSSVPAKNYDFEVITRLPTGAGLGSSASICVGIAGVLLRSISVDSLEEINKLAFMGETLIHGRASGIDNTVVTYGGLISYTSGKITNLPLNDFPVKLLLVNSRVPKVTKTMVERVRVNREKYTKIYDNIFASIQAISETLVESIQSKDLETFKECLRINNDLLKAINICGETLSFIVDQAWKCGIKGKMTGGGGGGTCVFAVTTESISEFQQICENNNWEIIVAELSSEVFSIILVMGICTTMPKYRLVHARTLFSQDKRYGRSKVCKIKKRNLSKKIVGFQEYFLSLEDPLSISSFKASLDTRTFWTSSCVLQASNPKDTSPFPCQDRCQIWQQEGVLLVALFDGFGSAGHIVSEVCIEECESFFYEKFLLLTVSHTQQSPSDFLVSLFKHLDHILLNNKSEKVLHSGCSAVVSIINELEMTTAHIGDTRAIKATLSKEKKYGVGSLICKKITEEHRPEHMEEFSRITFTGARVQKLVDINGQHIGPYRVWEAARNTLGLKISRCLGSSLSRNCGIISTPGLKIEKIDSENDVFLVFGSSGFWEAFDSQELVNFIEAYRGFCVKGIDIPPDDDFITFSNTCIAQLACEEGRSNWISKIEDEDAHMEDLSCVIIELKQVNLKVRVINDVSLIAENLDELKNNEARKAPTLKDSMIMKESKRKSVIGVSILNSKTDMN